MQGQYSCSVNFVVRPADWRSSFEPDPQQARKAFNLSTWLYGSVGCYFVLHCCHPQFCWLDRRSVFTRIRRGCILCEKHLTTFRIFANHSARLPISSISLVYQERVGKTDRLAICGFINLGCILRSDSRGYHEWFERRTRYRCMEVAFHHRRIANGIHHSSEP